MANNSTTALLGSNAALLGGYNFGFNENSTQLTGNHFKVPILVSAIAMNALCVLCFFVLVIITCWMKGSRAKGRKVFGVLYGLLVALFLAYARTMADEIIHEYEVNMTGAYLLVPILKQVLSNGTDTTLIYVVYSVIKNRFIHCNPERAGLERIEDTHLVIWIVILLFGITDLVLYSVAQVYISDNIDSAKGANISNWYRRIHLPYVAIYCAISVEMFFNGVFIWWQSRSKQTKISILLVSMITPFLVFRSASNLALTIIYVHLGHEEQQSTGVMVSCLLGITSVVVYGALVTIGFDEGWDVKRPARISNVDGVVAVAQQFDGVGKFIDSIV